MTAGSAWGALISVIFIVRQLQSRVVDLLFCITIHLLPEVEADEVAHRWGLSTNLHLVFAKAALSSSFDQEHSAFQKLSEDSRNTLGFSATFRFFFRLLYSSTSINNVPSYIYSVECGGALCTILGSRLWALATGVSCRLSFLGLLCNTKLIRGLQSLGKNDTTFIGRSS